MKKNAGFIFLIQHSFCLNTTHNIRTHQKIFTYMYKAQTLLHLVYDKTESVNI